MHTFHSAGATDLDPLSAFPAESEIEQEQGRDRTIEIAPDPSPPEFVALIAALHDLQTSVNSLAAELSEIREVARGMREDAARAIAVIGDFENRICALESRRVIGARPVIWAARGRRTWLDLRTAQASHFWEWCVTSWRRLLAASWTLLSTGRIRS